MFGFRYWFLLVLASCAPTTAEDLRYEGEALTKKLVKELRGIESKEDLQKALPKLRKQFNKIADLLIEAKNFPCASSEPSFASEELFLELARLYEMQGARELVELSQMQAVKKLCEGGVSSSL